MKVTTEREADNWCVLVDEKHAWRSPSREDARHVAKLIMETPEDEDWTDAVMNHWYGNPY